MRMTLFLILVLFPQAATAAQSPSIPAGTRVKVTTRERSVAGTLMSQTDDSIDVAAPNAIRTVVASDAVTRIAVSQGRSRAEGALRGMTYGAAYIGGAGVLLSTWAYVGYADKSDVRGSMRGLLAAYAICAAIGAIDGAMVGALIGAERWSTVYSAPIRVSFGPSGGGSPGVGVSIRF